MNRNLSWFYYWFSLPRLFITGTIKSDSRDLGNDDSGDNDHSLGVGCRTGVMDISQGGKLPAYTCKEHLLDNTLSGPLA